MIDFSKISLSPSSNISMIVDAELSKCYEKLPDISDMTTDQILQYMQLLYMAKLRDDISWIKENTEGIANTVADKLF
mgnify:FL=1|jgi:hypothetical protein